MARDPELRQSLPLSVVGLLLLACTVSGLAAGVGVHKLVDSAGLSVIGPGTQGNHATGIAGSHSSPATSPTPGLATVTASPQSIGYDISAVVSPTAVAVGQQFSVTATVTVHLSTTPAPGVRCMLGPPAIIPKTPGSGPSLFTQWPAPAVSDSQGKASWHLQAPNVLAGIYQLVVLITGAHQYYVYSEDPLTIT